MEGESEIDRGHRKTERGVGRECVFVYNEKEIVRGESE